MRPLSKLDPNELELPKRTPIFTKRVRFFRRRRRSLPPTSTIKVLIASISTYPPRSCEVLELLWRGSSSGRGRRTASCRWSSLDQGAGLFVFDKCAIASPIAWHRPVQFGVNPLNRSIALDTSNNAFIAPGAGAFVGFDNPAGSEEDRLFRLSWACPSVSFYATAVIKVFCLCDSADRRSAARPGSAAAACLFFFLRLLHDTRDVRCSVCLSALHFAHQRARAKRQATAARRSAQGRCG